MLSFTNNSFGYWGLNAVTTDTSPAFALDCEHPTDPEYAEYLQGIVECTMFPFEPASRSNHCNDTTTVRVTHDYWSCIVAS